MNERQIQDSLHLNNHNLDCHSDKESLSHGPESEMSEAMSENLNKSEEITNDDDDDENSHSISTSKSLDKTNSRRGIVYISRIPPGMTPSTLKRIFSVFGEINRVYARPLGTLTLSFFCLISTVMNCLFFSS